MNDSSFLLRLYHNYLGLTSLVLSSLHLARFSTPSFPTLVVLVSFPIAFQPPTFWSTRSPLFFYMFISITVITASDSYLPVTCPKHLIVYFLPFLCLIIIVYIHVPYTIFSRHITHPPKHSHIRYTRYLFNLFKQHSETHNVVSYITFL